MTEYINKDLYRQIPPNERHFINLNSANADEMIRQLKAAGIEFSATLSDYRRTVTVRRSDSERADAILDSLAKPQQNNSRIIGNTEYKYISDKKYINTDAKTALQIANLLSGDTGSRFSGRIVGDRATITVSGDSNAAVIRRMIENLKNTDIIEALREAGYERIPDSDGFVNIRNNETGVVCGFDGMDMVRDMFNDPENEFFHPTAYRIEFAADTFADPYYIAEYDIRSGEEKSAYYDSNGSSLVFAALDDALSYAIANNIAVTNTVAELNEWRAADREREDAAVETANNRLIRQFPMRNGEYPDDFIYNPDSGNYSWVFFNPDGNDGKGEFCEKTITPQDIYEAYSMRIAAGNEASGRNAFVGHLYEVCKENVIETGSGYFLDYANDYISKSDNTMRFYGICEGGSETDISAFIKHLEDNCPDVVRDKEDRQDSIDANSPMGNNEELIRISDEIAEKEKALTEFVSNKDFDTAGKLLNELRSLSVRYNEVKSEIQSENINDNDVRKLRSIRPSRKSVQNMLENEVAQTPKFEKLLSDEMGEKSAYEMRSGNNEWRNDNTKKVNIVDVPKHRTPEKLTELQRKGNDIPRGTFVNKDTGIEIIFSRRSIEEIIAKAIPDAKREIPVEARISALYQMQALIENAVCFDSQISQPSNSKKSDNTLFIHRMYGVIKFDNEMYLANLAIEESYSTDRDNKFRDTSNRLYSFRDIKITPVELLGGQAHAGLRNANSDTLPGVTTITIPQLYELVKSYDLLFFENPNAIGRSAREAEIQAQTEYNKAVEELTEHNRAVDNISELDKAKKYIEDFLDSEYSSTADFSDMQHISEYIAERDEAILDAIVGNTAEPESKDNEPVPQNIMDIILEDMPSLMKSAVAWDELMEYGGIAEQFEAGKDPAEVVKSYINNKGSFSYSPDELKTLDRSMYCSWSAKDDNENNAVISVNVTNLDTYSEYESKFTMPWAEIADAFKTRIEQERNLNKLADRNMTVSAISGTDKYRFIDTENNRDEVKSRDELMALFSEMFNKSELKGIIRNYIDLAPTETNPEYTEYIKSDNHELREGDIVTFPDRPDVWRVSEISDLQISFENVDETSPNSNFSHIDFGAGRDRLQETLKYVLVSDAEERERSHEKNPEAIITQSDIDVLQNLPPRKSILNFSDEERKLTSKWAERYRSDIAEKSPYYRAENGDWRADETTRIPIIEMENKNISFGQIKDEVKNGTIERGNIINSDTNWNINISRKGLEDTIRYADKHNNNTSYNLLENVNAILKNSVLLDSQISDDNKNNKANSTGIMHKFYSVVRIGTEPYIAKSTVEEFFNGNMKDPDTLKRFYNLQDIKIEPLKNISFTENQLHSANFNGFDISISDLFRVVKSCDKDFYTNMPEHSNLQQTQGNSPMGNNYEPKINDVVNIDDVTYRITDISSNLIFMQENDTLIPEERHMTAAEFMASGFEVIEENGEPTIKSEPTAAQTETHNFVISDDDYGVSGGAKTRYADNVAAIETLKTIESEHRTATPEEQQILAKYTGWGAIPQAFDINNDKWRTEYAELRTLLTPDEYAAARRSTLNAHYTSPTVISAIYDGLKNLGFESGKILEPAMGTGNFFGAMPEDMRSSKLYGVELDDLTGRIAQQLYPEADIQIKGFEQTAFADNSFDAAVGNVPFGDYKLNDKRYNDNNFLIHDYFFAKALDKVHPGGIVAFVTSKGTLDKENPEVRKYLAQRAELLGAIRLPNNAFKANAGTEVTSDIIFLQKRERPIEIDPDEVEWLKKAETADGLSVNNYFVQHPEMVLGKIVEGNKMYGNQSNDTMCIPIEGADLKEQLSEAVKNIHGRYRASEIKESPLNTDEIPAPADSRKYAYYAVDGSLYYRESDDTMKKVSVSNDVLNRAIDMIGLRDNIHELLNLQLNNTDGTLDGEISESRKNLNNAYDSFVSKYGNVSDRKNAKAMQGDNGYNIVSALEIKNEKGEVTGKADIFTRNTVKPKIIAEHVETAEEALILSVSEKGKVDFDFMTELSGIDRDKLISELTGQIFRLPQEKEKYVTADEYLTGNIRKKLRELENAPDDMDISENRKALEAAVPAKIEAKDISVKLGAHWVDPQYIKQFILEKFRPDFETRMKLDVQYSSVAGAWKLEGVSKTGKNGYEVRQTYGTKRKNAYEILEGILNNSDLMVKDRKKDENGIEIRDSKGNYILVTNDEETKAVRHCANLIKSEFRDWIFKDPDRREALVNRYNEVYNSIRQREYDGSHLNFVGMNTDIKLKDHQKNAVARALYGGNTLLAHAVGAGKSYEMIAIAMEGKRLGMHNKALFAVPNSLTEQMGNDFRKLYPNANILVATQKDFERPNRMQLLGKIAANDWDAVIVGHSQFDRMGLSPEREKAYLTAEIDKLREELENAGGEKSFTVKQIEKSLAKYEDKLQKINDGQVKDDFIDFEQLGFDKLFIDESHMYKNLATPTKMKNVSGLGSQGSARAFGLLMKGKYLDELTGGKGMVFASGTPVSNSMTELYTLMRYLQADTLKECGINHFDEWAADFGEVKTDYELKPESDGKYQLKTRFAKFTNLPELMGMFKECADIRTADTLDLEKPKANVKEIVANPSKIQKRAIKSLGKRAAAIRNGNVDPTNDNMLCVTNDGRKIGLDQRLLDPSFPDDPNSKVNLCVNNVFDIYSQTADKRSTQCIFCDLSTPKSETRQDRFMIYRPDSSKELGYDVIRKKTGIAKDMDFAKIKTHVDKAASEESDKLRNGDIAVIRRPSEDMTKIISEAAVFENGKFDPVNSTELLEKLAMSPVEDMPPKEFNVYDDIKNKLMAKGVPEKEIAFIHDYDTAEQKQKLFNQMNSGDVRILLGSTSKCGAGMNAQKKMIALHHLDAPMRPSDMEQRNGRIERQGNENPEVQIYRYVTDKTFDAYLYQMLENKQRFISQVMTSKTPERTCADIDEAALDYAEVKALCAGNPLIKEEMELQAAIKDLKTEKSRYMEKIYELQDNIRVKMPSMIQTSEVRIKHITADLETARSQPKVMTEDGKETYPVKIGDRTYSDRKEGGTALKLAIADNIGAIAEGKTIEVGEYRGLKLSIFYDTLTKHTKACLEGEKHHYCELNPETDSGNLIRLDNCINNIEKDINQTQEIVDRSKAELEQMKIDVEKPFGKADELSKAEARLEEVHEALTKLELTDDSMHKEIFERFCDIFPDIMHGYTDSERYEAGDCFDTLSVELHGDILSVAHTYEQNGDLMYDPRIDFEVDYENEKVIPVSYENSGMGIYNTYDSGTEPTPESVRKINEVLEFTDTWLDNIEEQGYEIRPQERPDERAAVGR